MLIVARKKGQSIIVNDEIEILITSIDGDQVKVGIKAPAEVKIFRKEVLEAIEINNKQSMTSMSLNEIKKLLNNAQSE
ncbi:MAG TPA: carbon storage regulator CsrA [Bacilli bacterium]